MHDEMVKNFQKIFRICLTDSVNIKRNFRLNGAKMSNDKRNK